MSSRRHAVVTYYNKAILTLLLCTESKLLVDVIDGMVIERIPTPVMDLTQLTQLVDDYAFMRTQSLDGVTELVEQLRFHPFKKESIANWKYGQMFQAAERYMIDFRTPNTSECLRNIWLLMTFK